MNSKPLHSNTSRYEGCTLTGALSVTTSVTDGISIIHGPAGCAHHNFSLLHTIALGNDSIQVPKIISTGLLEKDIIFGGEEALEAAIRRAAAAKPAAIFVISTCIVDTIGDDIKAVCSAPWEIPVIVIPSSGFLGGVFQTGYLNALRSLAELAGHPGPCRGVNLIGEKNLEFEVEPNYQEIVRLLSLLDVPVNLRFVRNIRTHDIDLLGGASLNILRDPELACIGEYLQKRFGTPYISKFPEGLSGTCAFLDDVGEILDIDSEIAVNREMRLQKKMIERFREIRGRKISIRQYGDCISENSPIDEIIRIFDLSVNDDGPSLSVPVPFSVGTYGISRMLHRWRRALHA